MQTLFVGPEHVQSLSFMPAGEQPVADAPFTHEEKVPFTTQGGGQPFNRLFYFRMKRLLDLALTLCALGLLWPVLVLIAIAIKVESPGPLLVAQERVGSRRRRNQDGLQWEQTRFCLYKFRTTVGTPPHTSGMAVTQAGATEKKTTMVLTQVGRFLHQSCLDQLPQLWNILSGDLTLVGPRPALPAELNQFAPTALRRFETLPGMTGLWQLREPSPEVARSQSKVERERQRLLGFEKMIQADLEYIEKQSLGLDLQILGNTFLAAFRSPTHSA